MLIKSSNKFLDILIARSAQIDEILQVPVKLKIMMEFDWHFRSI